MDLTTGKRRGGPVRFRARPNALGMATCRATICARSRSVGRDGLAHLAYGSRTAAHVFDSRREAEDIVRRLRRRATIGAYDYLVEEFVGQAGAHLA